MARAARFAGLLTDTIVAVASAPGEGGRAILRLSGEGSFPLVQSLVRLAPGGPPRTLSPHPDPAGPTRRGLLGEGEGRRPQPYTVLRGELVLPGWAVALPVLLYLMPAPWSYTREDVAEIHLAGSPPVVLAALEACSKRGARLAHAGEFTRRALLAGRITLSEAEAVLKVVDAQEEADVRAAVQELGGSLGSRCTEVAEGLFELVTQVEAGLDFSQEDITFVSAEALAQGIAGAQAEVEALLSRARESVVQELPTVLLFGRPNVGKSSLFNRLLGRDAALVTPVAGTTRDAVEGILQFGGFRLRLLDGAGQADGPGPTGRGRVGGLELRASARTRQLLAQADLTLHLIDGSRPLCDEDRSLATVTAGRPHLWVLSKADLPRRVSTETLAETTGGEPVLRVSAKSGRGLEELRGALRSTFLGGRTQAAGARPPDAGCHGCHAEGGAPVRGPLAPGAQPDRLGARVPVPPGWAPAGGARSPALRGSLRGADESAGAGFLLNARQRQALARSASALAEGHTGLAEGLGEEFVAADLWEALDALGEVTGQRTTDDLLDAIFSRFCIGK